MIFLTVGSELPFNRLVKAVDDWAAENDRNDIIGQIADPGPEGYQPEKIQWRKFISAEEYDHHFTEAELIIGHAGMGSIITAALKNKAIIIMPRRAELKETRNDHQVATAEKFSMRAGVLVANNESEIGPLLDRWVDSLQFQQVKGIGEFANEHLLREIRNFILNS